jgi:hypothetical protein
MFSGGVSVFRGVVGGRLALPDHARSFRRCKPGDGATFSITVHGAECNFSGRSSANRSMVHESATADSEEGGAPAEPLVPFPVHESCVLMINEAF